MLPTKFRRAVGVSIPVINAVFLFGILNGQIGLNENIASTGITPAIILGLLNIFLLYLIAKHQVP